MLLAKGLPRVSLGPRQHHVALLSDQELLHAVEQLQARYRGTPPVLVPPSPVRTTSQDVTSLAPQNESFPQKLYRLLDETERHGLGHIIGWTSSGKAFCIFRQEEFCEVVAPRYFRHKNFNSFKRQLHLYQFAKVTTGFEEGSYHHPDFQRGRIDQIAEVRRLVRSSSIKAGRK